MARKRTQRGADGSASGEIGVTDPFQLVRLLARSQSDPRKAVSELVQNALDEQASHVQLTRRKQGREIVLSVFDNGRGVLPHLGRAEALETIARSIGHSRKRQMSFDERMRAAMLGQYGIGLLGFWSLGHELRMLSRVDGSAVWALSLFEDSSKFEVSPAGEIFTQTADTWTEVQIIRIHPAALSATSGLRLQKYLGTELRGQLIRHGASLTIVDTLQKGAAGKTLTVSPTELAGERLALDEKLNVPGFQYPIELNLYFTGDASGEEDFALRLAAAGAVVVDDIRAHPAFQMEPWSDVAMAGIIDFPHLEIPPGSRRGFIANDAAQAMVEALTRYAPVVAEALQARKDADASRVTVGVHRQLAKLFAKATELVPHLEWFEIGKRTQQGEGVEGDSLDAPSEPGQSRAQAEIFPPGPPVALRLSPKTLKLEFGETAKVTATLVDADGKPTGAGAVDFSLSSEHTAVISRTEKACELCAGTVAESAVLRASTGVFTAESSIAVAEAWPRNTSDSGIPSADEVNEPQATWRSQWLNGRWRVNVGHSDYKAFSSDSRARVQYLAQLLSKEVVARNFPRPEIGQILEEMVGVLAALERTKLRTVKPHNED